MMKNLYEDEEFLKFLKKEGHTDDFIEFLKKNNGYSFSNGKWSVSANHNSFKLNNKGIKLAAKREELLSEICFDVENKIVSLTVETPTLPPHAPRKVDLSDDPVFFLTSSTCHPKIVIK